MWCVAPIPGLDNKTGPVPGLKSKTRPTWRGVERVLFFGPAGERGLSFVEVTIILSVLSVLTAVLSPSIADFVRDARDVQVREDTQTIGSALERMLRDTGETMVLVSGAPTGAGFGPSHAAANRVTMLTSDGNTPTAAVPRAGLTNWDSSDGVPAAAVVRSIESQLMQNTPAYRTLADMSVASNFDPSSGALSNSEYGWRGAYLSQPGGPDPWGWRYAVNTEFLGRISGSVAGAPNQVNFDDDVFVISPGANGIVDTAFAGASTTPAGDDVLYMVSGSVPRLWRVPPLCDGRVGRVGLVRRVGRLMVTAKSCVVGPDAREERQLGKIEGSLADVQFRAKTIPQSMWLGVGRRPSGYVGNGLGILCKLLIINMKSCWHHGCSKQNQSGNLHKS
jgi:type II secretory pathway pseudopilin PulG